MASDNGLNGLAARLDRTADMLNGDMTSCGHAVGKGARTEANQVARSVAGGDMRLSHMGRKGVRLGMRYEVEQQGRLTFVKLVPAGPWILTEKGAGAHLIGMPRGRGRRRRGPAPVSYLYGGGYPHPVRGPVAHPGTGGKGSITRTFVQIRGRASRDFHEAYVQLLGKVWS